MYLNQCININEIDKHICTSLPKNSQIPQILDIHFQKPINRKL